MNVEFRRERGALIRDLAEDAGPWVKDRLLKLAARYEEQAAALQHPPRREAIVWPSSHTSER